MTRHAPTLGTDWRPLAGWNPPPDVLAETLDGGQAFRWFSTPEPPPRRSPERVERGDGGQQIGPNTVWTGQWADQVIELRAGPSSLEWRGHPGADETAVRRYLALDRDWDALTQSLPWRSDAHLAHCLATYPGLRILRQPFGETLLGFLCSATKQIVQIKQMLTLLAERHGAPLCRAGSPNPASAAKRLAALPSKQHPAAPSSDDAIRLSTLTSQLSTQPSHPSPLTAQPSTLSTQLSAQPPHRLPTWPQLALIPERDLRTCLLGFRARYIAETARFLAARPGWLEETETLPYAAAKARLLELPGVGEKVADCVLLFGAGRLEAFPVDTWVLKALARRYGLEGWKPAQVAHFGRTHFGPLAGLAQQYLFAWERRYGGR